MPHAIKEVLTVYNQGFLSAYGVPAPIEPAKDSALAQKLLRRYTVAQLTDFLGVFFRHPDPFIQQSGHTFGVFYKVIGKCITRREKPQTEEQKQLAANRKIVQLIRDGMDRQQAIQQVSREMGWIK